MKTLIAQLNHVAVQHQESGLSPVDAVDKTASDFGLVLIHDDEDRRIYKCADDTLINAWLDNAMSDRIEHGGLGFDDQIEWFVDDLITQAEAAEFAGVSVQAINNAIRYGRLRGYKNAAPETNNPRHSRLLVRQSEVENQEWGK